MSKKNKPMVNGKPKTLVQMGLSKGYRLTNTVRMNIIRVALRTQLKEEVMRLLDQEIEILHCCNGYIYPVEKQREYNRIAEDVSGHDYQNFSYGADQINFAYAGTKIVLGTGYKTYSRNGVVMKYGIMTDRFIESFVEDKDLYWVDEPNAYRAPSHLYVERHMVITSPFTNRLQASPETAWQRLPKKLRMKILQHCKKCEELRERVESATEKLKMILAEYSSPVKLGNDIPETVNWMLAAEHMNEQGRLCTDVPSADRIQEMRKDLGLR